MPTMVAPKVLSFASIAEREALDQAALLSQMPFISSHVALMPDVHLGKGSSVGTVIPTKGAIIPAAVGVDVGCGMSATRTKFSADDLEGRDLRQLRDSVVSSIPMGKGHNNNTNRFAFTKARVDELYDDAQRDQIDLSHSSKWPSQLGSLGGGNHFIELCVDQENRIWLFLHSGSRGVGNKIAQKHIKIAMKMCADMFVQLPDRDLAYLPEGTPEFNAYIKELRWGQKFALYNRDEMLDRFRQSFAHFMGVDPTQVEEKDTRVRCHHNYTEQENHGGENVWVTRKGAIRAREGDWGLIPGSMGTRSYVVQGKGHPGSFCSAPHGAGRVMSRTRANENFTIEDLRTAMEGIVWRDDVDTVDEIPGAYKDIDQVMEDAKDLVEIRYTLRQLLNIKGN